jgi:hypothetical protein
MSTRSFLATSLAIALLTAAVPVAAADIVGKVAEIESTRVSALMIYHSNTKIAKVLNSLPTK